MKAYARHHLTAGVTVAVLALAFLACALFMPAAQAECLAGEVLRAPTNPEFFFASAFQPLNTRETTGLQHPLGERPGPQYPSIMRETRTAVSLESAEYLPVAYDLRTLGRMTQAKDQLDNGTCWAFASCGSLESSLLTGETWDFSEDNMTLQSGFYSAGDPYGHGGNMYMSGSYLLRWGGPVTETEDRYDDGFTPSGLSPSKHLQEIIWIPARTGALDNDTVKTAVMQYGAAYVAMRWESASYNSNAFAYNYTASSMTNHAVLIVGWNDNYPAGNFLSTPAGNGAFIAKNSWGSDWGDGGYFYISYYDMCFGRTGLMAVFNDAEPSNNYTTIYQYDPLGYCSSVGYGTTGWFANEFTASTTSTVSAVGFYTLAPGTTYEVWAGSGKDSMTWRTSGVQTYMGYHTVALPTPLGVVGGQKFAVGVKVTSPGEIFPIALEDRDDYLEYSPDATSAPGQSYVSSTGSGWTDITSYFPTANVCLKAYATSQAATLYDLDVTSLPAAGGSVTRSPSGSSYPAGTAVTLTAVPSVGYVFAGWSGDAQGTATPITVTMDSDKSITATFSAAPVITRYEQDNGLLVYSGTWSRVVGSAYSGRSYATTTVSGSSVTAVFTGTAVRYIARLASNMGVARVTLDGVPTDVSLYRAVAANKQTVWSASGLADTSHTLLIEWTGLTGGGTGNRINLDALDITGVLNPVPSHTLTTAVTPEGCGSVTCTPSASSYLQGTVVAITATASAGYAFAGWNGDVGGKNPSTTVTMDSDKSVTAVFEAVPQYSLTTLVSPEGTGTITRGPNGSSYDAGTPVTLTAVPNAGYVFTGWSGDAQGTERTLTVIMDSNKTVTAAFDVAPANPVTTRYEQNDAYLAYVGTWSTVTGASYSGGSYSTAGVLKASVIADFTGTAVSYVATTAPSQGIARVILDGVATTVDLYSPSTKYKQTVWSASGLANMTHSLIIEYTGTKNVAATGKTVNLDALDVTGSLTLATVPLALTRYEENNSYLAYAGTWSSIVGSAYSGSRCKTTKAAGAKVTVVFTGTAASYIARTSANMGIARVTLDGTATTVDLYSKLTKYKQTVWSASGLANTTHTLVIEYTGTKNTSATANTINVDAFDVVGVLTVTK